MNGIFSRFTQKYILRGNCLPDSAGAPRLAVDMDLNWHWAVKGDDLYVDIEKNFEKLVAEPFLPYSIDPCFSIKKQPFWDISEENEDEPGFSGWLNDDDGSAPPQGWRKENLAYYVPAHTCGDTNNYGIHLTKRGIARLASEVHQLCPDEPIEIIQLASVYKLFVHEICHAWIENICCLVDFNNGEKRIEQDRRYSITNKNYNSYIFMEEAICNTAAHGFLHDFLHCEVTRNNIPAFNPENIMKAFEQWMRGQPKGYRDFCPITSAPYKSSDFIRNILRLLVRVYGIDFWHHQEIFEIVGDFFGCRCRLAPSGRFVIDFKENSCVSSLWREKPPLHVEL